MMGCVGCYNFGMARDQTIRQASLGTSKTIGFLLIPGFSLMSYACCVEPLRAANHIGGAQLYKWRHAAPENQVALASNGLAVSPDLELGSELYGLDLLLVCAGGNPAEFSDRKTFEWLRRLARRGVAIAGVSGGPLIMARAGLLEGRRATVHWEHTPGLAETHPDIRLTHALFEIEDDRLTCSGGVAALDMMISLITRDHGQTLGAAVSDWFLHTTVRDGKRPQRMDLRSRLGVNDERLLAALRAMEGNLERPLSCEKLAALASLSLRQLERLFRRNLGRGVHRYYLELRLRAAHQLLRETSRSILAIAVATGFCSSSHFTRVFHERFGMTPRSARA
jgi:transcriptional regulator GlxA family with amidase domain